MIKNIVYVRAGEGQAKIQIGCVLGYFESYSLVIVRMCTYGEK